MATDTPHALLSPSKAARFVPCPGSIALSQGIEDSSSVYADEGTAAHELGASALMSKDQVDCDAYLGQVIKVREEDGTVRREFTVDEDMADYVQVYVDAIRRKADGCQLLVEQRVDYSGIVGVEDQNGTADAIILDYLNDTICVDDLKYGRSPKGIVYAAVEVDDLNDGEFVVERDDGFYALNLQAMLYGLGAYNEYEMLADWKTLKIAIHQPRLDHYDEFDVTIDELTQFVDVIKVAVDQVMEGFEVDEKGNRPRSAETLQDLGLLNPSESACRWCPAKFKCPELRDEVQADVFDDFEDLTVKDMEHVETSELPSYEVLELVEMWLDSCRSRIQTELLNGTKIPGWKVVLGRKGAMKFIPDLLDEVKKKLRGMRLKKTDIYNETLKSPTQLLKLPEIKGNKRRVATLLDYVVQADAGYHIAPENDKREAVEVAPVADDFENLDEE